MRARLVTWTLLTSVLVALGIWALLGPPEPTGGPHWPGSSVADELR